MDFINHSPEPRQSGITTEEARKMGYTDWSDDSYHAAKRGREASGEKDFSYSEDMSRRNSSERKVHQSLNPSGVTRESRDSVVHPESLAIMVVIDVTGSMRNVPRVLQQRLPKLMGTLLNKGIADPQVLFGAVGDAYCDRVPLQIGQFESGVEMDADLRNFFLEGGGGSYFTESYELAIYFAARRTSIDCLEKRGKKGYLFIIGDEMAYDWIKASQVSDIMGDKLSKDISIREIVTEASKKYHIFYLLPKSASGGSSPEILKSWRILLGQDNVREMTNAEDAVNIITDIVVENEKKNPSKKSDDKSNAVPSSPDKKKFGRLM